ncbi:MAG: glycoside hydrolase domain-containing protein [Planctomycetota bacterium]
MFTHKKLTYTYNKLFTILLFICLLAYPVVDVRAGDPNDWADCNYGLPMRVITPWTALVCGTEGDPNATQVSAWGRTYEWDSSSLLPCSITSGGTELLQNPMSMMVNIEGNDLVLTLNSFKFASKSDPRVIIEANSVRGNLTVDANFTVDFDGFVWAEIAFHDSSQTIDINALRVDVMFPTADCKYYQTADTDYYGAVVEDSDIYLWWPTEGEYYRNYYHWFGNEDRGLGFAYSSMQYWKYTYNFCTMLPRNYWDTYRMHMLESAEASADGLVYRFAFQATPIKPLPPDYHSMVADAYNNSSPALMWKLGDYLDLTPIMPDSGDNGGGGDIFPGLHDPENVNDCLATMLDKAHDLYSGGITSGPALCPQKLSETIPNVNDYLADWQAIPQYGLDWQGVWNYDDCPGSNDFVNWMIYQWKQRIDEFDMDLIYFDGYTGVWPCKNTNHGCGYVDDSNVTQETIPLLEARTAFMRFATMLEDNLDSNLVPNPYAPSRPNSPNYHFMIHCWQSVAPILGFGTSWLTGEYLWGDIAGDPNASYAECLGLDKLRARSISNNYGVPNFWDCVLWEDTFRDNLSKMAFAWMLPHGNPTWPISVKQIVALDVYEVMREFRTRDANFTPCWQTNDYLDINSPDSDDVLLATWVDVNDTNEVLAVVSNIYGDYDPNDANDPNAYITLSWKKAMDPCTVTNAITRENISYDDGNDAISLVIGPEDFRLLWINGPNRPPEATPDYNDPLFTLTFNKSWNADFAIGDANATVHHDHDSDPNFPDIAIGSDGSGKFSGSSPNNLALHHPKGGTTTNNLHSDEYVYYNARDNFRWEEGSYIAWVKPDVNERTTPQGFIISEGDHWSYVSSLVVYDEYYSATDQRAFLLNGRDGVGTQKIFVSVVLDSNCFDTWTFVAVTWQLVEDANSSTGYNMDSTMAVRPAGAASWVTDSNSRDGVSPYFNTGHLHIGSDAWGNRGYGGWIDWVQIYGKELSMDDINDLYAMTVETTTGFPGVTVTESGGSTDVSEAGVSDTYTIVLDCLPSDTVTITVDPNLQIEVNDMGEGNSYNLTFTTSDWNTPQTVTVKAIDDFATEGNHSSQIVHTASCSGADYNSISIDNVTVNITDDDVPNVLITQSGGSTDVNEENTTTDTYTVVLDTLPTATVTITVDPDVETEVNDMGAGTSYDLTFTTADWNSPQTVTVKAIDDYVVEGAHTSTITHTAVSDDSDYNGLSINNVVANVSDNDYASVTITESNSSTSVCERGPTSDTYTLVLASQPSANVAITVDPDAETQVNSQGAGNTDTLTFTTADWNTPQTVTVAAIDDSTLEYTHSSTIVHTASSTDEDYNGISIDNVVVAIADNDNVFDLNQPLFFVTFNNGWDADYAAGSTTATVHHDANEDYPDIELGSDGSGVFTGSSPNNISLHHPKGGTTTDTVSTDEYVYYSGTSNFNWSSGTYAAWVKPNISERTFTPAEGFIVCEGSHWSYPSSWVLYDTYYYTYNRDFILLGKDGAGTTVNGGNALLSGGHFGEWIFIAATWELVADGNSATGYRMDGKVYVRPAGDNSWTTGSNSAQDVNQAFTVSNIYVGSDAWGNRGYGGEIDWVQIYNYPLSDDEVNDLYMETREHTPDPPDDPIFVAKFNDGFDADYAVGSATATVNHDPCYPDIEIGSDGSGPFSNSSPNNLALHHPKGGTTTDNVDSNEFVYYDANGNFNWDEGSYVAWVKPDIDERTFTSGFIVSSGQHWSYPSSWVLYDTYYYTYNRDFVLQGKDAAGTSLAGANALLSGGYFDEWVFVAATWELVADANSATGYRMDTKVVARPNGAGQFTTGTTSITDVNEAFTLGNIYIGSDSAGDCGYGGSIDWVQVYNYALTEDDIEYLYYLNEEIAP